MPFESGGLADKLGNRYEARWITKQLLSLLNEKNISVTVEAVGDDEKGVDLWVLTDDGIRQAHQCKARNASKEFWSISDLENRGVLSNLKYQLDRDPNYEFVFISSVGASNFNDICEYARRSVGDPYIFYNEKIQKQSKVVIKCFNDFCNYLSLNFHNKEDLKTAFDYLRRTYIIVYPDDYGTWNSLLGLAEYLLLGDPKITIPMLVSFAVDNNKLGSPIYVDELRNYLSERQILPKLLAHDNRIFPVIEKLQLQFNNSIHPQLIGGSVIGRSETDSVIDAIERGENIILSGGAGAGKSGILFEVAEYLRLKKIPYLPIRLDRKQPKDTATLFGQQMGLPDCPAFSLSAYAGERKCVLILDQLDAIRWTSAHSNNALDVCKEIGTHVRMQQLNGSGIVMILSSRTFDLENDPGIRNWLTDSEEGKFTKVVTQGLPTDKIKEITGPSFSKMTEKEIKLLSSPLNLSLWMVIWKSDTAPKTFRTSIDLMREFWKNRRLIINEQTTISNDELNRVITVVVDYMERMGRISMPERIISPTPRINEALFSYGLLQQEDQKISFCHQSYLDYLIADRVLMQIETGQQDILKWLGEKSQQSLFRREQLRQALVMLSEESSLHFFNSARQLIESENIRFHIKHLVLELFGALDNQHIRIFEYCLKLYQDEYWCEHIINTVFWGHTPFVKFLSQQAKISGWLESSDNILQQRALMLLGSVAENIPDIVANELNPFFNQSEAWNKNIINTMPWHIEKDSNQMFLLRLKLFKIGVISNFIDFPSLCKTKPFRSVQLINAILHSWNSDDDQSEASNNRYENWYEKDIESLKAVAKKYPAELFDYFIPHVIRLTDLELEYYDPRLEKWRKERNSYGSGVKFARGVVELIIVAGKELAEKYPEILLEKVRPFEKIKSDIIQEIIIEAYTHLPDKYSDIGINWILDDPARFRLGEGDNEPEWQPAVRLIKNLSPSCSSELFTQLEETITHYHSPDEKRNAEYYLTTWKKGFFGHYWGKTQYFLLPALSSDRIKASTHNLIAVLRRKFENYSEDRFLKMGRTRGGWVGSKLNPSLEKISDRAWLGIVTSKKVGKEDNHKWIQKTNDSVLVTSIRQFSSSLRIIAKRYPERFAKLALKFPEDIDPAYIAAVIDGCCQIKPDANFPDELKNSWQPASIETIEAVLNKFRSGDDRNTAMAFCNLITVRSEENWSKLAIRRLIHYAKHHPDLKPGRLNIHCEQSSNDSSVKILFENTINCVRGVAARAIGQLLWEHVDLFEELKEGIEALINDPHPVVRMAAAEMLLPILNIDKDQAVEWFVTACGPDLRVAASPRVVRFYNYTIPSHANCIGPIIKKMVYSTREDVAIEGAIQVTARWLFHGLFANEFNLCKSGKTIQRQGVAKIASQLLQDKHNSSSCHEVIKLFLDDPQKEVRDELRRLFWNDETLNNDANKPLILAYIKSQTFFDDQDVFIRRLKEFTGSMLFFSEIIFNICDTLTCLGQCELNTKSSQFSYNVSEIGSLLLRLYENAIAKEDVQMADLCLDKWDILFENRIGVARDLTDAIAH